VRRRNIIILCIALIMGGVAALLARNWLLAHSQVSSSKAGTIATALPEGAFQSKEELLNDGRRVVLSPLASNEPIMRSKVTGPGQRPSLSSLLREGNRAVTVRVDDVRGVAGFILPGDFVDVVLIKTDDEHVRRENYAEMLLQRVKVLAIDQLASERQEQPTVAKAVTLEVTPEQAQRILLATNVGKLSLILRQPEEAGVGAGRRISEKDLSSVRPPEEPQRAPIVATPEPVIEPARPANTATVAIVRGMKRDEYKVMRDAYRTAEGGFWPEALTQSSVPPPPSSPLLAGPLARRPSTTGKAD
jgi:pilus assembly protein CpaB